MNGREVMRGLENMGRIAYEGAKLIAAFSLLMAVEFKDTLEDLVINVHKDWKGYRIKNVGKPVNPKDAARLEDVLGLQVTKLGISPNYVEVADDGFLTLHGDARTSNVVTLACENWYPTHHNPFGIKALADPGYISSTLTAPPDTNRKLRVFGVGDGIQLKGEQAAGWTPGDTTHDSIMCHVDLATKNASWEQATSWMLVLDVLTGDTTGQITIYLPSFKMDAYETIHLWFTNDGASYYGGMGECDFRQFAAGAEAAEELLTSDVTAGDNVICPVADTTGFYISDKARLIDDNNAEWNQITAIVANTSITIAHLNHSYATTANAKIKKINCVHSPCGVKNMRRGMGRLSCLEAGVPSGIGAHYAFPFTQDPDSPLRVALVFCGDIDNPTSETVRMRLQYFPTGAGDNCFSEEWGEMSYIIITPGAKAGDFVETLFTGGFEVPANKIENKKAVQLQVCRMGDDIVNDTYTGGLYLVAVLIGMTQKHFGRDIRD